MADKSNNSASQYVNKTFNRKKTKVNKDSLKNQNQTLDDVLLNSEIRARDTILDLYRDESKNDGELKKSFAKKLLWVLIIQIVLAYVIFILIGFKILKFSEFTVNLFISGTLLETFGLVNIILKYLFSHDLKQLLLTILNKNNLKSNSKFKYNSISRDDNKIIK